MSVLSMFLLNLYYPLTNGWSLHRTGYVYIFKQLFNPFVSKNVAFLKISFIVKKNWTKISERKVKINGSASICRSEEQIVG